MTQTVIPQLRVTRMDASLPFYRDGMGFVVDWSHRFEPGLPWFLQVTRAGQTIFLSEHAGDCQVGGAAYFKVPDVDACARDFGERGLVVVAGPEDTPWGTREMSVIDPDGNRLRFATHPDEAGLDAQ
jgi:catechol 2,3-dioxygenase-like lactoylglutathione lyase family enzyme